MSRLTFTPRLMGVDDAAAYLGISKTLFLKNGPPPRRNVAVIGKRILWDIHDLDKWADQLRGLPLDAAVREAQSQAVESAFFEKRRASA